VRPAAVDSSTKPFFFPLRQDLDGSGSIRYTEFLAATIEAQGAINEERLAEAFDRIDADDSGYISTANLKEMLGDEFAPEELDAIIKEAATDNDGKISYAEFLALWEDRNEQKREEVISEIKGLVPMESISRSTSERTTSLGSNGGSNHGSAEDLVSRANFIEQKVESTRRASSVDSEKHVAFQEAVTTIPEEDFDLDASG
jgi:hypothetical protein